jgi:hypothetical protein
MKTANDANAREALESLAAAPRMNAPAVAWATFLRCATERQTVLRAFGVALVITPILTLVNHWDEIRRLDFGARFIAQVCLTFCVPYLVSTFSSARTEMAHRQQAGRSKG